jgi:hypothetical protein
MPTIELHGFPPDTTDTVLAEVTRRTGGNPFADRIVLLYGHRDAVVDLGGQPRPFLRVLTRSPEAAQALRQQLATLADVEVVQIGFYERSAG